MFSKAGRKSVSPNKSIRPVDKANETAKDAGKGSEGLLSENEEVNDDPFENGQNNAQGESEAKSSKDPAERVTPAEEQETLERHEEDTEAEAVKRLKGPKDPSEEEIETHYASGHAKYRAWCRCCVGGRGKPDSHKRHEEEECQKPIISCD